MVTRLNQTDGTKLFVKNQSESVQLHSTHSQDKCQMSDIFIATLSKLNDFHELGTLITKSLKSFRNQMARRGLHPREADHLRGCGWSLGLRQTTLPPDQNSMKSL